jgi:uncharacterized membrane protein (DUF4010 family)
MSSGLQQIGDAPVAEQRVLVVKPGLHSSLAAAPWSSRMTTVSFGVRPHRRRQRTPRRKGRDPRIGQRDLPLDANIDAVTIEPLWPYLPTLRRLGLALAIGLFIGLERERRGKEAGLRTFGFAALLGALGAMLGQPYALVSLGALAMLATFLNVQTFRAGQGAELTTAAALVVTGFAGILCGLGHTLTPAAVAVVTAALLAWKERLAAFSKALTEAELRSAILLAILAFVVYPALPEGAVDRWRLFQPRAAWLTVLLVAGMGFANYVLLKVYGSRGVELTGFLGGLVNSTVTVAELAERDRASAGALADATYRGVVLATAAMVVRNSVLLFLLSASAFMSSALPFALMAVGAAALAAHRRPPRAPTTEGMVLPLESPFSVRSAIRFGAIFVGLQIAGTLAQRGLGGGGFYAISFVGGFVSSASAVASAGTLAARGAISPTVAGVGAVVASIASAAVNWPLARRISRDRRLTRRLAWPSVVVALLGAAGVTVEMVLRLRPH